MASYQEPKSDKHTYHKILFIYTLYSRTRSTNFKGT